MVNAKFVAEFTTNHMGNLNVLMKMVEKAKWAGADYIKMQKKDVESFYSEEKLNTYFDSPYGHTYRDYRTIFEFNKEDFQRFDKKCKEEGIEWFSTVQDIPSLHFMLDFDLPMYKIASSNARNWELINELNKSVPKDRTIIISVAGSTLDEIDEAVNLLSDYNLYILHCVAKYPCPVKELRLGNISKLHDLYGGTEKIQIGYSGHEVGYEQTKYAKFFGANLIERHFCLSRHSFVHHIECSLEPKEFKAMIDEIREIEDTWKEGITLVTKLPEYWNEMTREQFGMDDQEEKFLVHQTYGRDFLKGESIFNDIDSEAWSDRMESRWEDSGESG